MKEYMFNQSGNASYECCDSCGEITLADTLLLGRNYQSLCVPCFKDYELELLADLVVKGSV